MIVKLLTENHLEFLSLKGGCKGSSESTQIKMPHCLKFHALAQIVLCSQMQCIITGKNQITRDKGNGSKHTDNQRLSKPLVEPPVDMPKTSNGHQFTDDLFRSGSSLNLETIRIHHGVRVGYKN